MKNLTKLLALMALPLLIVACEKDEFSDIAPQEKISYNFIIGTHVKKSSPVWENLPNSQKVETNPRGGVILEENGSQTIAKKSVNMEYTIKYTIEDQYGRKRPGSTSRIDVTADLDNYGGFAINQVFNMAPGEKISSIDSLNLYMSIWKNTNGSFSKTYKYSDSTLWDMARGIYSLFGELELTHVKVVKHKNVVHHVLDIDSDIVLKLKPF